MLEKLSSKSTYILRNHPIMIPAGKVNNWYPCSDGNRPWNYRGPISDDFIENKSIYPLLTYIDNEYEKNDDGTITDHATGLVWDGEGSRTALKFHQAQSYICLLIHPVEA